MPTAPKILYKYLKPKYAKIFLARPQLHFTNFLDFDDVLEVLPGQRPLTTRELDKIAVNDAERTGLSTKECRRRAVAFYEGPWWGRRLRDIFKKRSPTLFISCLTELWDSDNMWALYAAKHRGLVFGVITKSLPERATKLGQVRYRKRRPLLHTQSTLYRQNLGKVLVQAASTKSREWAYQKEWRVPSGSGEMESLPPRVVAEIVVGYEASKDLIEQAVAFKKLNPRVRIYQAYPHPQEYRIIRREI